MNQGSQLDIPLSENPVVFGYRTSQGAEENIQVLTGDFAAFQASAAGESSGIRVIPQDEWELHGYEVREFEGQQVLHNIFDYTEVKLKQRKQREQKLSEAAPDVVGELKAENRQMKVQLDRVLALLEKATGGSPDVLKAEEVEASAKQNETEELKALAEVAPKECKPAQRRKPGPKPKAA